MRTVWFKKQLAVATIVGLLIAWGVVPAGAQAPTGVFSYTFTTSNVPLWDVTGTYTFSGSTNTSLYTASASATFVVSNAPSGQISGTPKEAGSKSFRGA